MNGMIWSLIIMYAVAFLVLLSSVLKDMRRSIFRGCVSLVLAMLAIPLAMLLTHNLIDRLTTVVLHLIDLNSIAPLMQAFPSLEESVVGLVHMVTAPELYRLMFIVVMLALAIVSAIVCHIIERKKPALAKKHKGIGAGIGVVFGLVLIVAYLTPTAGYAAEAPEVIHVLGEYEQISHEGEEEMSEEAVQIQSQAQKAANTPLLKVVRALGGEKMFDWMTTVEIDGEKTDLHTEFHALDILGADVAVLTAVPMEDYTDKEYDTLKAVGDVFERSTLLRVLGAEGLSAMSKAWLKNELFIGIARPDMGTGMNVALDAAMVVLKDTNKDTIAKDIRGLAPAISAAMRAFNTLQNLQPSTPDSSESSDTDAPESSGSSTVEVLGQLVDAISESADSPEAKEVLVRAGIGLVAKELGQLLVTTDKNPSSSDSQQGSSPSDGTDDTTDNTTGDTPSDSPSSDVGGIGSSLGITSDMLPEGTEITQETYDQFVGELTDLAVAGVLKEDAETVVEEVKDIRDLVGIDLSDEMCEQLVNGVLNSPFASLFK